MPSDRSVRYGDQIQLYTKSHYTQSDGDLIGSYHKNFRTLFVLSSPVGSTSKHIPCIFHIRPCYEEKDNGKSTTNSKDEVRRRASIGTLGTVLRYGDPFVLVVNFEESHGGQSWNNRTSVSKGFIGPRKRDKRGEMFVTFSCGDGSSLSLKQRKEVCYEDQHVYIDVLTSNRHRSKFNQRVSNFKKSGSYDTTFGGYLRSDGKGSPLEFTLKRASTEEVRKVKELHEVKEGGRQLKLKKDIKLSSSSSWNDFDSDDDSTDDEEEDHENKKNKKRNINSTMNTTVVTITITKTVAPTATAKVVPFVTVFLLASTTYQKLCSEESTFKDRTTWINDSYIQYIILLWCTLSFTMLLYKPTDTTTTRTFSTTTSGSSSSSSERKSSERNKRFGFNKSKIPCTQEEKTGLVHHITDDDVVEEEEKGDTWEPMPHRIITAEGGDIKAAKERWFNILKWRRMNGGT
jgi:hypothetical protein